nr:hypothetical protein [Pseudomonas sp. ADAK18]
MLGKEGQQLRGKVLLALHELIVVCTRQYDALGMGCAAMDLEDLTNARMVGIKNLLSNDRLVLGETFFEQLIVVGGNHRVWPLDLFIQLMLTRRKQLFEDLSNCVLDVNLGRASFVVELYGELILAGSPSPVIVFFGELGAISTKSG